MPGLFETLFGFSLFEADYRQQLWNAQMQQQAQAQARQQAEAQAEFERLRREHEAQMGLIIEGECRVVEDAELLPAPEDSNEHD